MAILPAPQKIIGPSLFRNCCDTTNLIMDWANVVNFIRSDQTLDVNTTLAREKLRDGSKKGYDYFKKQAPAISPACQIAGKRLAENAVALTGIAMVDSTTFDSVNSSSRLFLAVPALISSSNSSKNHPKNRQKLPLW